MNAPSPVPDDDARGLLLHRLPQARAQALEERLLADPDFAAQLREAEQDLLDDCAHGRLSAEDRAAVEHWLLQTPRDRARMAAARALASHGRVRATRRRWRRGVATAAIAASLALVSLGLPHLALFKPSTAGDYTVALLADGERGNHPRTVEVPAAAANLRLQVEIPDGDPAARYRLLVDDADGRHLAGAEHLAVRRSGAVRYLEAVLPATALGSGPRILRVEREGPSRQVLELSLQLRRGP